MAMIVGVRFNQGGKIYDFDPGEMQFLPGDKVMVETSRGIECGEVVRANRECKEVRDDLKPVLRRAAPEDLKRAEENAKKAREAMKICQERIAAHKLEMKLVDAEYAFDNSKITFNFTAEGRVDFRNLVKDLASTLHTRIELHQIGVRDEAKKLGGIGICGQPFCCSRFLKDFQPVSIKMAKEQGLSLNPTKISGSCGRLMCCLQYEQSVYEELNKLTPKNGTQVTTPEGRGTVVDSNVLTGKIKVRLDREPEFPVVEVLREDLNKPARTEPAAPVQEPVAPAPAPIEEAPVQPPKAEKPHREAAKQNRPQGNKPAGEKPAGKPHHRPRHHRHRHKQQG
ncbi:MAG: stage 0 sporulation protein [Clostridia bacterium]|nr:stage 0 sporulation protein [Clostridia bacterium]